MVGFT